MNEIVEGTGPERVKIRWPKKESRENLREAKCEKKKVYKNQAYIDNISSKSTGMSEVYEAKKCHKFLFFPPVFFTNLPPHNSKS